MDATMFALHPKLAEDTFHLGDFPLSLLLLMNDANFPWFILVPRRAAVSEIYQLSPADQQQLLLESSQLARRLAELFQADKMNLAALGNMVPQLHLHHVVRYHHDACWPDPVWGKLPATPYEGEHSRAIGRQLAGALTDYSPL